MPRPRSSAARARNSNLLSSRVRIPPGAPFDADGCRQRPDGDWDVHLDGITEEAFSSLAHEAHRLDITFNHMVERALHEYILDSMKKPKAKRKPRRTSR